MKLLSSFPTCLIAAFYCVYLIATVNCELHSQDGNSEQSVSNPEDSSVNLSRHEPTDEIEIEEIDKLLHLLQENYDQLTTRNQQVFRRHETLGVSDDDSENEQSPSVSNMRPEIADSKQDDSNRLNRRSASELDGDNATYDSESSSKSDQGSDAKENSHGRHTKPFDIFKNGFLDNVDIGLPPQPVKKIIDFMMDRLKSRLNGDKEDEQSKERFPRKLFERSKNVLSNVKENAETLSPVGIHRTLKLGPWSVNFDMGKP